MISAQLPAREGQFLRLKGATLQPGPPLLIGGHGLRQTLAIAARYADERTFARTDPPLPENRGDVRPGSDGIRRLDRDDRDGPGHLARSIPER